MFEFTLMKNMFYELDPEKVEESVERRGGSGCSRTLSVDLPEAPEVKSVTMMERYVPYGALYHLFINDEEKYADIKEDRIKRIILAFYRDRKPSYLKEAYRQETFPENLEELNILDCFEVDKMPGYDRKYAYSDLLTLEDLRKGKTGDEHKPKTAFPGMRFSDKYRPK